MIFGVIRGGVFCKINNRPEHEIVDNRTVAKTKIIVNRL